MQYKNILNTDLNSSAICLGGADFGGTVEEDLSYKLMDLFYDMGGNIIDTANVYSNWLPGEKSISEKTIGKWLKKRSLRNKILISTKGGHPELTTMNISRLSPNEILNDLNESIKSLQTDYIDMYWLHRDDEKLPIENILDTLEKQVEAGKIRYYGCSNWKPRRIKEAMNYAEKANIKGFVGNRMMWSLAKPNYDAIPDKTIVIMDKETMELHINTELTAFAYSSQANGFFSKFPYISLIPIEDRILSTYYNEENIGRFKRIENLAKELSVTIGEIVLGYLTSQPFTTIPIVGCKTVFQLNESLKAGEINLSVEMLNYLENGK